MTLAEFEKEVAFFDQFGTLSQKKTLRLEAGQAIQVYTNEFWTSGQRKASSLHEIPYRSCFKPQLPSFFLEALTRPGDTVYDPFLGRGTTLLEAAILGRRVVGSDVNPLSQILIEARLNPPPLETVRDFQFPGLVCESYPLPDDLLLFYNEQTLRELLGLRQSLMDKEKTGDLTPIDRWIRMLVTSRLSGHSKGFLSRYTLPPNQAASPKAQARINSKREETAEYKNLSEIVLSKSRRLLNRVTEAELQSLRLASETAKVFTGSAQEDRLPASSVDLIVTSPPFLGMIDYAGDNWLRCWFNGIDSTQVKIWSYRNPEQWSDAMHSAFRQFARVLKPGGSVAFEVGEVKNNSVLLENFVLKAARGSGLRVRFILINQQNFTKTSNCWGISNDRSGTNSNRVVLLEQE